jgi:predicted transcriptional regulator
LLIHSAIVSPALMSGNSRQGIAASAANGLTVGMTVSLQGDFGAVLREWRNRRRLSQIDLALESGTTQRHVSFLEQGRSAPGATLSPDWPIRWG